MADKKGFVQIELITGILLFSIFVLIVAEYTTKIKTIYHTALQKIEALSLARNILEMQKGVNKIDDQSHKKSFYSVLHETLSGKKTKDKDIESLQWKNIIISCNKIKLITLMYTSYKKVENLL